ncbi:hypothetical protein S101450_00006 [Komagataeibacter saccharivorans]|nr:hypothetical protein S101450_00006 [Komagataeibacter saccharivorans]
MVERFPAALADPLIEIGLYGRERRELPPLAVGRDDIKGRLHDAAQVNPPRSPRALCTLKVVPAILHAGDFSLSHLDLIRFSQTYES